MPLDEAIKLIAKRVVELEKLVRYPNTAKAGGAIKLKAQAGEMQAPIPRDLTLYAPLRSDTRAVIDLAAFARRLIDMQDLGHAVTEEVRELAKRALGISK